MKCSPLAFRGERLWLHSTFFLSFSFLSFHALVWHLELGIRLPRFGVAPRVGDMDSHTLAWPSNWGYGLPHFGMSSRVGHTDSHTLAWPLDLGIRSPALLQAHSVNSKDNRQSSFVLHVCWFFFSQLLKGVALLATNLPASTMPKPKPVCAQT